MATNIWNKKNGDSTNKILLLLVIHYSDEFPTGTLATWTWVLLFTYWQPSFCYRKMYTLTGWNGTNMYVAYLLILVFVCQSCFMKNVLISQVSTKIYNDQCYINTRSERSKLEHKRMISINMCLMVRIGRTKTRRELVMVRRPQLSVIQHILTIVKSWPGVIECRESNQILPSHCTQSCSKETQIIAINHDQLPDHIRVRTY